MQKQSVGRDVHYTHPESGETLAAKVTAVHEDGTVDLAVLSSHRLAQAKGPVFTVPNVPSGPGGTEPARGCWNWPPRV